jgi:hypothetical protein
MTDDTTSTTFVGSHERARAGYGTNGDPNPSSVKTGVQPKLVEPKVAPPAAITANANARDDDKRLGEISGHPVAAHPAMAARPNNSGSPSGKVVGK